MIFLKIISLLAIFLFVCLVFFIILLSFLAQHSPNQMVFLTGTIPTELPDGLYQGTVNLPQNIWQGKKFDRANQGGINLLNVWGKPKEGYPFKMIVGEGNVDKGLQTLKIDYDVPQNSFLVRLVVDEVVQTEPSHYLGKLEIRVLPNLILPLGYFELTQN